MDPSVPECAKGGDGNNVSSPPSKNALYLYDFVINNYTEDEVSQVCQTITEICKKGGFGKEIGESGTPHLQGYLNLKKKLRITALHKYAGFARASFRAVRNEEALIKYIQKDGNTWTFGFPKPLKIIKDLREWQNNLLENLLKEPDDRKIYWIYDKTGNNGKTVFAKYLCFHHNAIYVNGKCSDALNIIFNTDMDKTNIVIFDLPRSQGSNVSYTGIESIKNGIIYNSKYETGMKLFNSPHLVIFSNELPEMEKLSLDRWEIITI